MGVNKFWELYLSQAGGFLILKELIINASLSTHVFRKSKTVYERYKETVYERNKYL